MTKKDLKLINEISLSVTGLLVFLVISCAGCRSTLIPGYEILPLPAGTNQYTAGEKWLPGIGTTGDPLAPTKVSPGLNQNFIARTNGLSGVLSIPLIKWISGNLGLADQQVTILDMTNFSHITISEAKDLSTPVLWETVVVSNFVFRIGQSQNVQGNVAVSASQLTSGAVGNIQLTVTNRSDGSHFIQSDHPLVLAIRVVKPLQGKTEAKRPLDLSDTAVDKNQMGELGYEVSLQNPVDPVKKVATFWIDNSSIPEFKGVRYTFNHSEPWVSPARSVIAGADPKTRSVDYVWDRLSIEWNPNLSKCSLIIIRQYTRFEPVKSGIPGTR